MTQKDEFEPGRILHAAVIAAFRAKGETFHGWCKANKVNDVTCRNATHGLNCGPVGRALLERIIDAVGRDTVAHLYRTQFQAAADRLAS